MRWLGSDASLSFTATMWSPGRMPDDPNASEMVGTASSGRMPATTSDAAYSWSPNRSGPSAANTSSPVGRRRPPRAFSSTRIVKRWPPSPRWSGTDGASTVPPSAPRNRTVEPRRFDGRCEAVGSAGLWNANDGLCGLGPPKRVVVVLGVPVVYAVMSSSLPKPSIFCARTSDLSAHLARLAAATSQTRRRSASIRRFWAELYVTSPATYRTLPGA
mmetsp:Transcript_17609/g.54134  ORF Transcript_17609/g.54134 Transcript_17609/m.54134 type:complete len:216 (-) Transcript_17609:1374-2021(-)